MKITRVVATAIILALSWAMVVNAQRRTSPTGRRSVKTKPAPKAEVQDQTPEAALLKELETEIHKLSKLSDADKEKLRTTVDNLQREISKTKLGDRLAKARRNLELHTGGDPYASLQKELDECLTFLPQQGITRKALLLSWDALNDYLILEIAAEGRHVSNNALKVIEKYGLEGNSLYVMSFQVLEIGSFNVAVAAKIVSLVE